MQSLGIMFIYFDLNADNIRGGKNQEKNQHNKQQINANIRMRIGTSLAVSLCGFFCSPVFFYRQ